MSDSSNDHRANLFEKGGVRINGWRVPYPLVAAAAYALMTSSVSLYQIQMMQGKISEIEPRTIKIDRTVTVLEHRITTNENLIERHRQRDHAVRPSGPRP